MDITKIIMDQLGENGLSAMAEKIGADKKQTASALEGIMPTLLGAMSNNSQSESGASGLLGALDRDHDGSILDDITGFITGGDNNSGSGILRHVLGDNQSAVEQGLSAKTGLQSNQISSLLTMVAPILMGYLGKQKKQSNNQSGGFDLGGLSSLLGNWAGEADKNTGLDLNDILKVVGGLGGKSSGGLGGLLGNLFK